MCKKDTPLKARWLHPSLVVLSPTYCAHSPYDLARKIDGLIIGLKKTKRGCPLFASWYFLE
jgi:hypothetical protein